MYSAYDKQNERYFSTGRNSTNRTECEEDMIEYLLGEDPDTTETELNWILSHEKERQDVLNAWEVKIIEHENKIPEE